MLTEDKVTEIFCMADDFCKFFDAADSSIKCNGMKKSSASTSFGDLKSNFS